MQRDQYWWFIFGNEVATGELCQSFQGNFSKTFPRFCQPLGVQHA